MNIINILSKTFFLLLILINVLLSYFYQGNNVNSSLPHPSPSTTFKTISMVNLRDPGWKHGFPITKDKKNVRCNYCGMFVSGGINHFKK